MKLDNDVENVSVYFYVYSKLNKLQGRADVCGYINENTFLEYSTVSFYLSTAKSIALF